MNVKGLIRACGLTVLTAGGLHASAAAAQTPAVGDTVPTQDPQEFLVEAAVASLAAYPISSDSATDTRLRTDLLSSVGLKYMDTSIDPETKQSYTLSSMLDANGRTVFFVAFKGTDDKESFTIDVQFTLVDPTAGSDLSEVCSDGFFQDCTVHKGFESYAHKVGLGPAIALFSSRYGASFVFTGHSLGGALAKLSAAHAHSYLVNKGEPGTVNRVITFGAPEVGNNIFAASFRDTQELNLAERTHRWEIKADPVPLGFPPPYTDVGYEYVRTMPEARPDTKPNNPHAMANYVANTFDETGREMPVNMLAETPPSWANGQSTALRSAQNSNLCLDIPGWNTNNGINLIVWDCNNQNNQRWTVRADGTIRSIHNANKCLDPEGPSTAEGAPAQIWDCESNYVQQTWYVDAVGRIHSAWHPEDCLQLTDGAYRGAGVFLSKCDGGADQRWLP